MRPIQWLLFIGGAVVIAFSTIVIFLPSDTATDTNQGAITTQNAVPLEQVRSGLPVRLTIPKIKVDALIEHAGVAPDGTMEVPKGPIDVAWFDLGPRPGENGSAVIAGHVGWKDNIQAAFDNLPTLSKGDKLYVEDEKGVITTFVVRELRMYDQNQNDSTVFASNDGKAHLNLISCEGVWNAISKSYSKRLVVFTDLEAT
jgi:sortase A